MSDMVELVDSFDDYFNVTLVDYLPRKLDTRGMFQLVNKIKDGPPNHWALIYKIDISELSTEQKRKIYSMLANRAASLRKNGLTAEYFRDIDENYCLYARYESTI